MRREDLELIKAYCLQKHYLEDKDKRRLTRKGLYYPLAWTAEGLRPSERLLLTIFYAMTDRGRKAICPCLTWMAKYWGIKKITLYRSLNTLLNRGFLKMGGKKLYLPMLYQGEQVNWFWKERISYSRLGAFYFVLQSQADKIRRGGLIYAYDVAGLLSVFCKLKTKSSHSALERALSLFEAKGYVQRVYSKKRRGFKLVIWRELPFKPSEVPVPPIGISLKEYGLYVDAYLNANPDKTFTVDCLPRDFSVRYKSRVIKSMLKKGFLEKVCERTYRFITPKEVGNS